MRALFLDLQETGDAMVFESLDSDNLGFGLIIDTGLGRTGFAELSKHLPSPRAKLLVTHDHKDHTGNLARLKADFPGELEIVDVGSGRLIRGTEEYDSWTPSFSDTDNKTFRLHSWKNMDFDVDFLENLVESNNKNAKSVITRVDNFGFSYLLTGDAEEKALASALNAHRHCARFTLGSDVLKWPHHLWMPRTKAGTDILKEFLRAVDPQLIVVSNIGNRQSETNIGRIRELVEDTLGRTSKFDGQEKIKRFSACQRPLGQSFDL